MTKAEYMRQWRSANKSKSHDINRKSRQKNYKKWSSKINQTRRAGYRKQYLARQYGLTQEGFDALLLRQGGRCAICQTADPGRHGRKSDIENWHVDHDHKTGYVRGLLCFACNVGIGHLKDDPVLVKAALVYLQNVC